MKRHEPLVVMFSVPPPSGRSNPYTTQLAAAVSKHATVKFFSWKDALFSKVDILHVHWPETMVRGKTELARNIRGLAGLLFLLKSDLLGIKIVWTVHNVEPHESGSRLERLFLRAFKNRVDARFYINESDLNTEPGTVILHGHYRDWASFSDPQVPVRLDHIAYFGAIRPYKGVEELIEAASAIEAQGLDIVVAGEPLNEHFAQQIRGRAAKAKNVRLDLGRLSDEGLAKLIQQSKLIVLPYREFYNSGALLLSLSLNRPVLVPQTEATEKLQKEFGESWIRMYAGTLSAADLLAAYEWSKSVSEGIVDMSARNWDSIGERTIRAYQAILS